jgi:type IV pilus assembly protein PilM
MSLWRSITYLVSDPPPSYVFELSEAGVAFSANGQQGFAEFAPGTLVASPLEDNLLKADAASSTLQRITGTSGKKRPAAVILPDHAVRVTLLDFDTFPASLEEQKALVRFRIKKTIPFDVDSAQVIHWVQPGTGGKKKAEVVAVVAVLDILARYEALFRSAGYHPGEVTASSLAALELCHEQGMVVIARLTGRILTVMAVLDGILKLFRCLTLDEGTDEELLGVLQPTFAYVEDELGQNVSKLLTCGFARVPEGLSVPAEPLRSRKGAVNGFNAGLMGYMEAVS